MAFKRSPVRSRLAPQVFFVFCNQKGGGCKVVAATSSQSRILSSVGDRLDGPNEQRAEVAPELGEVDIRKLRLRSQGAGGRVPDCIS